MSELLSMGGYEFYVWSSYGLFLGLLIWDFVAPRVRERQVLRQAAMKYKRLAARQNA